MITFVVFADFLPFISAWKEEAALLVLKVKVTVSCPLSSSSRTVLAAGLEHTHTHTHSTARAAGGYAKGMGWEAEAQYVCRGACMYIHTHTCVDGAGLIYTEVKGCASPTHAMSLFGERVMGRGRRERRGVSTVPLSRASGCCLPGLGAHVPQLICLHVPPLGRPQ